MSPILISFTTNFERGNIISSASSGKMEIKLRLLMSATNVNYSVIRSENVLCAPRSVRSCRISLFVRYFIRVLDEINFYSSRGSDIEHVVNGYRWVRIGGTDVGIRF